MDPVAGNSVVTFLNASLRNDAKAQIDEIIEASNIERGRQIKRQKLGGDQEVIQRDGKFSHAGALKEMTLENEH